MDCLIRRDDNTIAYINKMHNYNPKIRTPRPVVEKKDKDKTKVMDISEKELKEIIRLYF